METKRDIMNHFRYLKQAIDEVQGEAYMNMASFHAELRFGNSVHKLYSKFVALKDGRMSYEPHFTFDAVRFGGWSNNPPNQPFWFGEKLPFKDLLKKHGLPIPDYSTEASGGGLTDVIVKPDVSAFGASIKGPYRKPPTAVFDAKAKTFFEKYITGRIVKIWFWNDTPVCAEIKDFPSITGDGKSTIKELVERTPTRLGDTPRLEKVAEVLAYYSQKLDSVLKSGASQIIDFRYSSQYSMPETVEEIDYRDNPTAPHAAELGKLGEVLYGALQADGRSDLIYTVDAVQDNKKKLWYLEANPFPFIHPFVYRPMVNALAAKNGITEVARPAGKTQIPTATNIPYEKLN